MGRRGPARAPDAAKLRRGETRPSGSTASSPCHGIGRRRCPRTSTRWRVRHGGTPSARWDRRGLITAADGHILRLYCEAWSRYRQAADMLAGSAPLLNDRGHLTKNPLHQVVRDNADHVRLLARELGLSPGGPGEPAAPAGRRAARHRRRARPATAPTGGG